MENFNLAKVVGGDSAAAQTIFGGHAKIREVDKEWFPSCGRVWFIADPETGKLKLYRANYDSSD